MKHIGKLLRFVRPYWQPALLSLVLLISQVFMDLAIPRLIQRIIDQGIKQHSMSTVVGTAALMLGISALSTLVAIGNNVFSIRVGEGVARDLREALFRKVQSLSFGNLDRLGTGPLITRLTNDVTQVQEATTMVLRILVRAPLLLVGSLVMAVVPRPTGAYRMAIVPRTAWQTLNGRRRVTSSKGGRICTNWPGRTTAAISGANRLSSR